MGKRNTDISKTVESVRSLCNLETGSLEERCSKMALAIPRFPSAFSKSIGFTLCGMAEEPTSSFFYFLFKIIHGNICPDITAKINKNIIDPFHAIKMCSKVIIMFDLCSELHAGNPMFFQQTHCQVLSSPFWEMQHDVH